MGELKTVMACRVCVPACVFVHVCLSNSSPPRRHHLNYDLTEL